MPTVNGIEFTNATYDNLSEVGMLDGADIARDVQNLRNDDSKPRLLDRCLDGADAARKQGWVDYVNAVASYAGV